VTVPFPVVSEPPPVTVIQLTLLIARQKQLDEVVTATLPVPAALLNA
jgi:hypothetical protein